MAQAKRLSREEQKRYDEQLDTKLALPQDDGEFSYRWIRFMIRGELDVSNINKRFDREEWHPVKADEVPPKYVVDIVKGGRFEGCIQNGDLILAKLPLEKVHYLQSRARTRTAQQEEGIRNQLAQANNDPRFPITNDSRTTVSKGQRRVDIDD